jgi:hypothetical protein
VLGAVGAFVVHELFTKAGEKIHPEETLLISASEDARDYSDGFDFAMKSAAAPVSGVRGVRSCQRLGDVAKRAGAVNVGSVSEGLFLEGGTRHDVSIVDMHARILKRQHPLDGASIACQSAGDMSVTGVGFNLDEQDPSARTLDEQSLSLGAPFFGSKFVNLIKGEPYKFEAVGLTRRHYVEWDIEAKVIVDGKTKTIVIDDHGRPFRVTGRSRSGYGRYYEWMWYNKPPRLWSSERPVADGSFQTPSGNIICQFPYSGGSRAYVDCGVKSGLQGAAKKRCVGGDPLVRIEVTASGSSTSLVCSGDGAPVQSTESSPLAYGQSEPIDGGIKCDSEVPGLTCKNRMGHGFFLSRDRSRSF